MTSDSATRPGEDHYPAVRRVLRRVLVANLTVSLVKITIGLLTGALSVVADGFHSLVDSASNLIGLAAVRLADRPADEQYPYGYQRYETLGALAIGGMMLAAVWEIARSVLGRLMTGAQLEIDLLPLAVIALTLPINVAVVVLETRAGRRLGSGILLADASHTRTDLYVTLSVLGSLIGVRLGWAWLDLVMASAVALLIVRAAIGILRESASWLADAGIADPDRVEAIARGVSGVRYVHQIRSRGAPGSGFVDLHVKVYPGMSTAQAHGIASEVERRLVEALPAVTDALVHIEPARAAEQSDWERIAYDLRQLADSMGIAFHDLHVHAGPDGGLAVELHLEMPQGISLGEAHSLAETFEDRFQSRWPRVGSVITHLEPLAERVLDDVAPVDPDLAERIRAAVDQSLAEGEVLEVQIRPVGGHLSLAVRAALPPAFSLAEAHARAEALERELLGTFSAVDRVVVHVEPGG